METAVLSFNTQFLNRIVEEQTRVAQQINNLQFAIDEARAGRDNFSKSSIGFGTAGNEIMDLTQHMIMLQPSLDMLSSRKDVLEKGEFTYKCELCGGNLDMQELLEVPTIRFCATCRSVQKR